LTGQPGDSAKGTSYDAFDDEICLSVCLSVTHMDRVLGERMIERSDNGEDFSTDTRMGVDLHKKWGGGPWTKYKQNDNMGNSY